MERMIAETKRVHHHERIIERAGKKTPRRMEEKKVKVQHTGNCKLIVIQEQ